jgi:hypothetical protein
MVSEVFEQFKQVLLSRYFLAEIHRTDAIGELRGLSESLFYRRRQSSSQLPTDSISHNVAALDEPAATTDVDYFDGGGRCFRSQPSNHAYGGDPDFTCDA